jgi:hypothetical protein
MRGCLCRCRSALGPSVPGCHEVDQPRPALLLWAHSSPPRPGGTASQLLLGPTSLRLALLLQGWTGRSAAQCGICKAGQLNLTVPHHHQSINAIDPAPHRSGRGSTAPECLQVCGTVPGG